MSTRLRPPILDDMTVVIPTLGRPILERSLEAIEAGSHWPVAVIVVDQSQSGKLALMARSFTSRGLNVVHRPSAGRGRAAGVNRGIELVETRFFAVTDDDCLADPGWLHALTCRLRREPGAIVTGRIEAAGQGNVPVTVTSRDLFRQLRPRLTFDSLSGGNMGAARELVQRLGMLDEGEYVKTAEDAEFAYRALRAGVPLIYDPAAGVAHIDWRVDEERGRQYDLYAHSHGGFYGKYLRRGDLFIALRMAVHWARAVRRWVRGALSGDSDMARMGRAYSLRMWRGAVTGWRQTRPRRRRRTGP